MTKSVSNSPLTTQSTTDMMKPFQGSSLAKYAQASTKVIVKCHRVNVSHNAKSILIPPMILHIQQKVTSHCCKTSENYLLVPSINTTILILEGKALPSELRFSKLCVPNIDML